MKAVEVSAATRAEIYCFLAQPEVLVRLDGR
jgi:hypothetical protein